MVDNRGRMRWSPAQGTRLNVLVILVGCLPVIAKAIDENTYASLEKAEEACIGWRQSGDVHASLSAENAWRTYGFEVGQGSCDYVNPSLTRRFAKQMNGKELVLSCYCFNDKANNRIEGRKNVVMEDGTWVEGENEGSYMHAETFRY